MFKIKGKSKKVFLGGTCNDSKWRDELIPKLKINYYNPVVPDWTPEYMVEERRQRSICDYNLYVITPRMTGVYSIAEVVDDSNKRPEKTILCILTTDDGWYEDLFAKKPNRICFTSGQLKSLEQVEAMVQKNGGVTFRNLDDVAEYLNIGAE